MDKQFAHRLIMGCLALWLSVAASAHAACTYYITLDSPVAGTTLVAPANVVFSADAGGVEDGCTVSTVKFYNGATLLAQVSRGTDGMFSYTWSGVGIGSYSVSAVTGDGTATDSASFTVTASQAPIVSLATPTGSPFIAPAAIGLSATASDPDGTVSKVEFFYGATLIATDTASPYQASYSATSAGTYSFTAKATDNTGQTRTTSPASVTITNTSVIGNVERVRSAMPDYFLEGWACSTARNASINVHVYVGGAAGTGTFVGAYAANLASEPAVATACKAQGTAYRYSIPLTDTIRQQHSNKLIYVHGISPEGQPNNLLNGSGVLSVSPPLALTRSFIYDANQQLCKSIEPETGISVMTYDAAGNLNWTASAQNTLNQTDCDDVASVPSAVRVNRTYDARNRIKTLAFPDGLGDTTYDYFADGAINTLTAANDGSTVVTSVYAYNKRRLLTRETLVWGPINWPIAYTYDANGSLASQSWHGLLVDYAPNALGQPTKAGTFASGVGYYPNGAIKQFTYGNGIVHTLTQNVRGLPDTSADVYGATAFLSDGYDYDQNGNIAAITDGATGTNQRGNRTMIYDGLDRLTRTASPMYGNTTPGAAAYSYDGLDNLTRVIVNSTATVPGRDYYYCYDANWRLTNVKTTSCSGTSVIGLGYDLQGNLQNENGTIYTFDFGNRLRSVSPASTYRYDGHGRRVWDFTTNDKYSHYTLDGRLAMTADERAGKVREYIQLDGSLLAIRERDVPTAVYTTLYQHTDALGSPVLVTDGNRQVVGVRNEYEPYGKVLAPALSQDGPGYAGHVFDAATGMDYMQQRYYDPAIGRFLSVDPVTANSGTGANFNRYWYANNNPYKFTDPDGRQSNPFVGMGGELRRLLEAKNEKEYKEESQKARQEKLKQAEVIIDMSRLGPVKDAIEVVDKLVNGQDPSSKVTGVLAGEAASSIVESVVGGKFGSDAGEVAGAVAGKVVGDTVESAADKSSKASQGGRSKTEDLPRQKPEDLPRQKPKEI